jgi:hypothetical protein
MAKRTTSIGHWPVWAKRHTLNLLNGIELLHRRSRLGCRQMVHLLDGDRSPRCLDKDAQGDAATSSGRYVRVESGAGFCPCREAGPVMRTHALAAHLIGDVLPTVASSAAWPRAARPSVPAAAWPTWRRAGQGPGTRPGGLARLHRLPLGGLLCHRPCKVPHLWSLKSPHPSRPEEGLHGRERSA